MGWGGSALAANTAIKNNRAMLKKHRYKRKLSLVSAVDERWMDPKETTFDQLKEIRIRIRKERIIRMRKVYLLAISGFILLIIGWKIIPWELVFVNTH